MQSCLLFGAAKASRSNFRLDEFISLLQVVYQIGACFFRSPMILRWRLLGMKSSQFISIQTETLPGSGIWSRCSRQYHCDNWPGSIQPYGALSEPHTSHVCSITFAPDSSVRILPGIPVHHFVACLLKYSESATSVA